MVELFITKEKGRVTHSLLPLFVGYNPAYKLWLVPFSRGISQRNIPGGDKKVFFWFRQITLGPRFLYSAPPLSSFSTADPLGKYHSPETPNTSLQQFDFLVKQNKAIVPSPISVAFMIVLFG